MPGRGGIAILVYDFRGSGVVRNALRIAAAARDAGLDVSLWSIRQQGDLRDAIPARVRVQPLLATRTARSRDLDSLLSVPALARALDERVPAVLFSSGNHTHLYAALALRLSKRRKRTRFVGRASNAVISEGVGKSLSQAVARPFERFQFRTMDRVVAVSDELTEALATLGVDRARLETVRNGIDLAEIDAAAQLPALHSFFEAGGPPVVLAIGRLSYQKNFEGLVRAFALARARRPLRLLILGGGQPQRMTRLRQLAAQLGVEDDVDLAGFVDNPFAFLARADLFVLNSRWEGGSNVLIEALACGCPVVATRAPTGIAEVMLEGRVGPLVPIGDDRALAGAMLERLDQPRGSEALRARASAFDLERTLAAYVRVLSEETAISSA